MWEGRHVGVLPTGMGRAGRRVGVSGGNKEVWRIKLTEGMEMGTSIS